MSKLKIVSIGFIMLMVAFLSTCKHEPVQQIVGQNLPVDTTHIVPPPPPPPPANDSICFNTQILPLITASCAQPGCHDATSHVEGLRLNSYSGIKSLGTSTLISYITRTTGKVMPPYPQPRMDTASINLIKKWIAQGALNRICNTSNCDTTNVKYSTHIAPLMSIYCKGCHNSGNKGGNVNLDNYTDASTNTKTGKVICTITATNGCGLMPKGGPALSTCNIRKIQIWAAANCPQ